MCVRSLLVSLFCAVIVDAVPTITFPINSQVPPVARIGTLFDFSFSDSTFASTLPLSYALSNSPSWLSLDGGSRRLSGTPPASEANTAPVIQITARDSTGSVTMNTTLVITGYAAPTVNIPLEEQLPKFGAYTAPSSILYYPSTKFIIKFDPNTFAGGLNHYAVTADNTPLPSWIQFDGPSLTFTGETPDTASLVTPPQTFGVQLISSNILGFADTSIPFRIVVANHELTFTDSFIEANTSVGKSITTPALRETLRLDGAPVADANISSVTAQVPNWLTFDKKTYALSGTAPANATSANITITVTDIYQDVATAVVFVNVSDKNHTLFRTALSDINATIGSPFQYDLRQVFLNPTDVSVTLTETPSVSWLSFNATSMILSGKLPSNLTQGAIRVSVNATSKSTLVSDSQSFLLNLIPNAISTTTSTSSTSSTPIATTTKTNSAETTTAAAAAVSASNQGGGLTKAQIIVATLVPITVVLIALALCIFCLRKRDRNGDARSLTPSKSDISRPMGSPALSQTDPMMQILRPRRADEQPYPLFRGTHDFNDANLDAAHAGSGKRGPAFVRRSHTMATIMSGPLSSHGQSEFEKQKSHSETALSRADDSWVSTQNASFPTFEAVAISSDGVTRNFSRKGSTGPGVREPQWGFPPGNGRGSLNAKYGKYRISNSSIQQTPAMAYEAYTLQRNGSRKSGATNISRRLSSFGHGSRLSGSRSSSFSEQRNSMTGFGHGLNKRPARLNSFEQSGPLVSRSNSWLTVHTRPKSGRPHSQMSALTESTDVLYTLDAQKKSIKLVPKSPGTASSSDFSTNGSYLERVNTNPYARPISRRDPRASPFFGGTSRSSSRATSRKSQSSGRGHARQRSAAPQLPGPETTNDNLERSIIAGLRGVPEKPPAPRDSLGISYGSPRDATGQLKTFVKQMANRLSRGRNSPQFDLEDSRFGSPEPPSPKTRPANSEGESTDRALKPLPLQNQRERVLSGAFTEEDQDFYDRTSLGSLRDSHGNIIQYELDESPELGHAIARPSLSKPFGSFHNSGSGLGSPSVVPVKAQENFRPGPGKRPVSVDNFHNNMLEAQMALGSGQGLGLRKQTSFTATYAGGPDAFAGHGTGPDSVRSFDSGPAFL